MKGLVPVLATLWLLAPLPAPARDAQFPQEVVGGFYAAYATFHPSDGIPDAVGRGRFEPWISPTLDKLLTDAEAAQNRFSGKHKLTPPLIDGDLFTSNFDGATSFKVGDCKHLPGAVRCKVDLSYVPTNPKDKPLDWSDTVFLVASEQGWRVDDIGYGATWAFGNKGRLTQTLKEAIGDAGR